MSAGLNAKINAYIDGNLSVMRRKEVEELISSDPQVAEIFRNKTLEREKIRSLIPDQKIAKDSLAALKTELRETANDLYPQERKTVMEKLAKILDTTVFEI